VNSELMPSRHNIKLPLSHGRKAPPRLGCYRYEDMATITISVSEENMAQLRAVAAKFAVKPEDLVRVTLDELLKRPESDFKKALDKAKSKNQELYRRLAG